MRKGIPGAVEDETSASSTDWQLEIRALFEGGEFWFALPPSFNDVTPVALTFEELSLKILLRAIRLSMVGIDMSSPEKGLLFIILFYYWLQTTFKPFNNSVKKIKLCLRSFHNGFFTFNMANSIFYFNLSFREKINSKPPKISQTAIHKVVPSKPFAHYKNGSRRQWRCSTNIPFRHGQSWRSGRPIGPWIWGICTRRTHFGDLAFNHVDADFYGDLLWILHYDDARTFSRQRNRKCQYFWRAWE